MTFLFYCNCPPCSRVNTKTKTKTNPRKRTKTKNKIKSILACSASCPPCSGVTLSSHSTIAATCKEFWVLSIFFTIKYYKGSTDRLDLVKDTNLVVSQFASTFQPSLLDACFDQGHARLGQEVEYEPNFHPT